MTLILTLVTGVLLALSLPPFNVEWVGWFALAPLLVATGRRRVSEAMGLGLMAGMLCGVIHVGWHPDTTGLHYAYLPFLWLAMLLAVVAGAATLARMWWDGTRWALFVAGAGVTAEWLTTFTPLPLNLAVCQYQNLPVLQLASLTGIWGVSFLLWWSNAALAAVWDGKGQKEKGQRGRLIGRSPLVPAALAVLLSLGCGGAALYQARRSDRPSLRVAAIQDHNVGETAHLVPDPAQDAPEVDREELTRQAVAKGARLVVWSEGCLGSGFAPEGRADPTLALAREVRAHLVVGYSEAASPKSYNCAAIVAPDGSIKGVHRKIHLFLGERQSVQAGREAMAFDTDLGRVGVEICFDSCHTGVTRRIAGAGAQIIAMPNYDPPTPRGVLHRLHASMLPFRAVENRVPFVRADPTGLSQIIDPTGRIVAESPLFAADTLVADVRLGDGRGTLFTRLGDWLAYLCVLGVVVGTVVRRVRP
jgi:apolipoprotein N-acyltransferase